MKTDSLFHFIFQLRDKKKCDKEEERQIRLNLLCKRKNEAKENSSKVYQRYLIELICFGD